MILFSTRLVIGLKSTTKQFGDIFRETILEGCLWTTTFEISIAHGFWSHGGSPPSHPGSTRIFSSMTWIRALNWWSNGWYMGYPHDLGNHRIYLSIYLSIYPSIYLSIYISYHGTRVISWWTMADQVDLSTRLPAWASTRATPSVLGGCSPEPRGHANGPRDARHHGDGQHSTHRNGADWGMAYDIV